MNTTRNLENLVGLLPQGRWTEVASRSRLSMDPDWVPVEGSPISLEEAVELRDQGQAIQALRYSEDTVTVVVVPRQKPLDIPERLTGAKLHRRQTVWDEDRVEVLRKLWLARNADGSPVHSAAKIAELMDVDDLNIIRGKAHRMGLPSRLPIRQPTTAAAA
jgi:hypothetical protein